MPEDNNTHKERKSEAQKQFEEADNAGRFAGNDADSREAREQAETNARQDTAERNDEGGEDDDSNPGEAQNVVSDDNGGRLEGEEAKDARNKSTEGMRQDRDD